MKRNSFTVLITSILLVGVLDLSAQQKGRLISGNVRSTGDSNPLAGVTVEAVASRSNSGTQEDGNFYIEIKAQDTVLVFKLNGYRNKEVRVGSAYEYQVFLEPENGITPVELVQLTLKTPLITAFQITRPCGRGVR